MSTNTQETTTIEQVDMDLDAILGTPGAENVMLPETEKKPSLFTNKPVDTSFLDKPDTSSDSGNETQMTSSTEEKFKEILAEVDPEDASLGKLIDDVTGDNQKSGRPKLDKSGTAELMKKLIDAGKIIPFEDDKPIDEYSMKDFEELIEANFQEKERIIREQTPQEFFNALPEELQVAAEYVARGGSDLKSLFKVLSQVEETRELDVDVSDDQERIVREYLTATRFGTPEEIEEEIDSWKDRDELRSKALKFKPKLDAMQEQVVQYKLAEQEEKRKQQQAQAQHYMASVYETLKPGELNGVKLDRRTQELLYAGLIQPNYPSITGKRTNLLGHLLEKYQYVEPNHGLIAEALWLLADPDGYKSKIKDQGEKAATEKTVRMLKTEEARKVSSSPVVEKEEVRQRTIARNSNIFKR